MPGEERPPSLQPVPQLIVDVPCGQTSRGRLGRVSRRRQNFERPPARESQVLQKGSRHRKSELGVVG